MQKWPTSFVTAKLLILNLFSIHLYLYICLYELHNINKYIIYFIYIYIYIYTFLLTSHSWKQFNLFTLLFFHINFWYYLDNHLLKETSQFMLKTAESFFVILGLILMLLYLLRAVKPFLIKVCKVAFCITPMLTALRNIFLSSPLLETVLVWGHFWSVLWYFSLFLENHLVLDENMHIYSW